MQKRIPLITCLLLVIINAGFGQTRTQLNARTVPIQVSPDGHIFVQVRVNDSSPVLFGLDSGFEQSAITAKQAKALNLTVYGEAQVAGGGENTQEFSLTRNVSIELSGMKVNLKEVGVLSLDFPSPIPNETISGILGYDFMSRFAVEIDFSRKVMSLYDPKTYRYHRTGTILRIKMLDNNPCVEATVTLPELTPVTGMFVIDTGAGDDIFFNSPFVRKHHLFDSKQEMAQAKTLGIGGASNIRIGYASSVKLGHSVINKPNVHFSLATKGDSASPIYAGHLGNGIFRQFKRMIVDPRRRRLILEQ
jgi:hypothetical protein